MSRQAPRSRAPATIMGQSRRDPFRRVLPRGNPPVPAAAVKRARDVVANAVGFTLLELMVVVAVLAILALMALPSYVDALIRNQVAEALPLADIAQKPIGAAWTATQAFPPDNASVGLPPPDKVVSNLVSSMVVQDGAIHMTFGNRAHGRLKGAVLTFRPAVVEDAPVVPVAWVCGFSVGPDKMTIHGENRTSVPPQYLPAKCRAG